MNMPPHNFRVQSFITLPDIVVGNFMLVQSLTRIRRVITHHIRICMEDRVDRQTQTQLTNMNPKKV
jgi:hypothetical protein